MTARLKCTNHGNVWILDLTQVILEDLPNEFVKAVKSYNRQVTDVFSQYLATVAKWLEKDRGEDNKLPLSGIGENYLMCVLFCKILMLAQ